MGYLLFSINIIPFIQYQINLCSVDEVNAPENRPYLPSYMGLQYRMSSRILAF